MADTTTDSTTDQARHAELEGERSNAQHWRRLAEQRGRALDDLKSRTSVRALLALDRRSMPLRRAVELHAARMRLSLDRFGLVVEAVGTRRQTARARADLLAALDSLPEPPPERRTVSIIPTGPDLARSPRVTEATGEILCFLAPTSEPLDDRWLSRLTAVIDGDVVAATPLLVHPARELTHATPHDLRVRALGFDVLESDEGVPVVRPRETGRPADPTRPPVDVAAAGAACFVVRRSAFDAVGGLESIDDLETAMIELCARLRSRGGRVVAVPAAVVADRRAVASRRDLATPIDDRGAAWRHAIDVRGPALLQTVRTDTLTATDPVRIAVTVAAPTLRLAPRWGDWHLALALARSLERRGHRVRIQTADHADDPGGRASDVHVVLRGQRSVRRTPGQQHVLWVISHPEGITAAECNAADLVLVASERFAAHLRERTTTPVEVLLQATDHHRFRPLPADPRHAHPVAVVAKTRAVMRPIVADALAAGLRPAIYGSGWEEFVDPELVVADYVPNEELPVVYSSVGVLLNDHWDTMRAWGFVSNRLFDALACGTPTVSDHLPEIADLFGDAIPTIEGPDELRVAVDGVLREPEAARSRARRGRDAVLAAHTFDHRSGELLEALARHGLDQPPS